MAIPVGARLVHMAHSLLSAINKSNVESGGSERRLDILIIISAVIGTILISLIVFLALSPVGFIASLFPSGVDTNLLGHIRRELVQEHTPVYKGEAVLPLPFPEGYEYTVERLAENKVNFKVKASPKDTNDDTLEKTVPILAIANGDIKRIGTNSLGRFIEFEAYIQDHENILNLLKIKITYNKLDTLYCISGQDIDTGQRLAVGDEVDISIEMLDTDKKDIDLIRLFGEVDTATENR